MINVDLKNLKLLEKELKVYAAKSYPFATKNTLNDIAFQGKKDYQETIKKDLINRNKFTQGSARLEKTNELKVSRQKVVVGSISKYMGIQEFGGTKKKKSKVGLPIPTSFSAGQSETSKPRLKLPTKARKIENVKLTKRKKQYTSKSQENFARVKLAAMNKEKHVYLETEKSKGIFELTGSKRVNKQGKLNGLKLKMIHSLEQKSVKIKGKGLLTKSTKLTIKNIPVFFDKRLKEQLTRNRLIK